MDKNFCSKCGHELKPGLKFCTNCGCKLNIDNTDINNNDGLFTQSVKQSDEYRRGRIEYVNDEKRERDDNTSNSSKRLSTGKRIFFSILVMLSVYFFFMFLILPAKSDDLNAGAIINNLVISTSEYSGGNWYIVFTYTKNFWFSFGIILSFVFSTLFYFFDYKYYRLSRNTKAFYMILLAGLSVSSLLLIYIMGGQQIQSYHSDIAFVLYLPSFIFFPILYSSGFITLAISRDNNFN